MDGNRCVVRSSLEEELEGEMDRDQSKGGQEGEARVERRNGMMKVNLYFSSLLLMRSPLSASEVTILGPCTSVSSQPTRYLLFQDNERYSMEPVRSPSTAITPLFPLYIVPRASNL